MAMLAQQVFDLDVPIIFVSELKGVSVQIVIVPDNCLCGCEERIPVLTTVSRHVPTA